MLRCRFTVGTDLFMDTNSGGCTGELGNIGLLRIHTLRPARSSVLRLRCASGARSQAPQVR